MAFEKTHFSSNKGDPEMWWDQLRNGNKKGLELIYTAYIDDMYRYGMVIKANGSFVKDCIQEVFVSLWNYRSTLKGTDNVKLYLFKCLGNKIHREVASDVSKYHGDHVEVFDHIFAVNSYEQDWIRAHGNELIRKKLVMALGKLPLRQREVIQLLFFENLSYEEVSSIMKLRIKSVYNLAWKAIGNLKKNMISLLLMLVLFIF